MRYIIALYEIDRAYGGGEEGGWWFDTGELVDSVLYDGGRYTAIVYEWTAPSAFPEVRPHYA